MRRWAGLAVAMAMLAGAPAHARWTRILERQPVGVAKATMTVTPLTQWNRWSTRPSKRGETWTQDGVALNSLQFFTRIAPGEPVYRERAKKDEPLPKFRAKMLAAEVVGLVEGSHRILLKTSLFEVTGTEPGTLAGHAGVRFSYEYTVQDEEVRRKGEGRAAIVNGQLYLITFAAPAIHYFDAGIAEARAIMDSAKL